jgi:hypothetical protein
MQLDSERAERAVAERDRRLQIDAVQLQVDGLNRSLAQGALRYVLVCIHQCELCDRLAEDPTLNVYGVLCLCVCACVAESKQRDSAAALAAAEQKAAAEVAEATSSLSACRTALNNQQAELQVCGLYV